MASTQYYTEKRGAKCPTSMLYACLCDGLEYYPTLTCKFKPGKIRCSDEGNMSWYPWGI